MDQAARPKYVTKTIYDEWRKRWVEVDVREGYHPDIAALPSPDLPLDCTQPLVLQETLRTIAHGVYRAYKGGELLYVGVSSSILSRLGSHALNASWWVDVDRVEVHDHPSRYQAGTCETRTIREERPKYNGARLVPVNGRLPDFQVWRVDRGVEPDKGSIGLGSLLMVLRARGWPDL